MAPQARRMALPGHPSDGAQYGRTARSSRALLSITAPSPPHLTMHCTADHAASIRVTGLEARVRNPSRPASNPSLAHTRGRRACTWRRHLHHSAFAFSPGAGWPMVPSAASAAS